MKLQGKCFKHSKFDVYYLVVGEGETGKREVLMLAFEGGLSIKQATMNFISPPANWSRVHRKTFAKAWERMTEMVDQYDLGLRTNVEGFEWPL